LGVPVDPEVKMIQASSAGPALRGLPRRHREAVAEDRADPGLGEDQLGTFVRVVGIDRHVRRTGRQDAEDREVQVGGTGGDPDAHPVADADAVPA
jgi:hypothetical protein